MSEGGISRGKAIGWTVAFFVCAIVLSSLFGFGLQMVLPLSTLWLQVISQLLGIGISTWLVAGLALKWGWADLRYVKGEAAGKGFAVGMAIGAVPALLAMALAAPLGQAGWSADGGTPVEWGKAVGGLALLLLPAAFSEELMFRGVGYVALSRAFGRVGPALVLSILFGAAHLFNPNVTGLGVANVALAGIFLSMAFWLPGGMYAATGAHLGWNLTLAALGAPVSGLPFTLPMLDYTTGGPEWLTGGDFGPEGGVIATVLIATASVLLFRRTTPRIRSGQAPQVPRTEEA